MTTKPKNPNQKKTVKNSEVRILHSVYNPETKTVIPAGSVVRTSDVKSIPDEYKASK
jgi:hypothetical protein